MKKLIAVLSVMSLFAAVAVFAEAPAAEAKKDDKVVGCKEVCKDGNMIKGKVAKEGDKMVCVTADGKKCELPADCKIEAGKDVVCKCDKDGKIVEVKEAKNCKCPKDGCKCGDKKAEKKDDKAPEAK